MKEDARNTDVFQFCASLAGLGSRFEIANLICMSTADMLKVESDYRKEKEMGAYL